MAQGCAIRKFPARSRTRSEAQGVPPGACFFGSFLCTSKERDAPAASGAMPDLRQARPKVLSTGSSRVCVFSEWRMLSVAGFQALADFIALSPTPLPQEEGLDRIPLKPG